MLYHLTPLRTSPEPLTLGTSGSARSGGGRSPGSAAPGAGADRDALLRHCAQVALQPDTLRLSLATLCARFVASSGPHWLGCFNQAQYAADHLGISGASFRDLVAVGDLIRQVPEAAAGVLARQSSYSILVELARLGDPDAARSVLPVVAGWPVSAVAALVDRRLRAPAAAATVPAAAPAPAAAATGDSNATTPSVSLDSDATRRLEATDEEAIVDFAISLPAPVAVYARATLDAAQLLLGHDAPPDQQLEAVVAEASTESQVTVTAEAACRRFGVRWPLPVGQSVRVGMRRSPGLAAARIAGGPGSDRASSATGERGRAPAPRGPAAWKLNVDDPSRRAAHRLHRLCIRQARRLATAQADLEDAVLRLVEAGAPRVLALPSIDAFAEQALGLAPRTVHDYLSRARRRRRDDPIATARAQGRIGEVQADLLERLVRRIGVSRKAIGPWVELAQRVTVRGLRDRVRWARTQADGDYRAWALAGYPVPDDDQLRTSARHLARCLADATPPDPAALLAARQTPWVRFELTARTGTLAALLQLMASRQDAALRRSERDTGAPGTRPATWWALLSVFATARDAWTQHSAANTHRTHSILERDAYRCAAAGCTSRRSLEAHHVHYKGRQGPDDPDNLATLCATHHRLGEHGGILRVRGTSTPDAGALTWEMGLDSRGQAQWVCRGDQVMYRAGQRPR